MYTATLRPSLTNLPPRAVTRARVASAPRRRASPTASMATPPTSPPTPTAKPVFALDFDGVACDSVGESAVSAWLASERLWPALFAEPAVQAQKAGVLDAMRVVRPVIETGYENLVQVRCLVEGVAPDAMLEGWPAMLAARMEEWKLDRTDVS